MENYQYLEVDLLNKYSDELIALAYQDFDCQGVEEFSIDEPKVDEILGERSYSGADIPNSVIFEVEQKSLSEKCVFKFYFKTLAQLQEFKKYLKTEFDLNSILITKKEEDWNKEWRKGFKPIHISKYFEVIPVWLKEENLDPAKKQIFIYPGMGFGTGNHETTFLCLKLYKGLNLDESLKQSNCLDFGCGSGILGIGSNLLDQFKVDMYDIDENALVNTKQNLEFNNSVVGDFKLLLPKDRSLIEKKYAVVFANILENVLLLEKNYLTNSLVKNGYLITSGLLTHQAQGIVEKYLEANSKLVHIETKTKGDWAAVVFKQL